MGEEEIEFDYAGAGFRGRHTGQGGGMHAGHQGFNQLEQEHHDYHHAARSEAIQASHTESWR